MQASQDQELVAELKQQFKELTGMECTPENLEKAREKAMEEIQARRRNLERRKKSNKSPAA